MLNEPCSVQELIKYTSHFTKICLPRTVVSLFSSLLFTSSYLSFKEISPFNIHIKFG